MHERSSFKFDLESLFLMWSWINLHNSMCLFWAAKWSGVQPLSFSGFFALIFSIICLHIFKWPFSAAKWSGVSPDGLKDISTRDFPTPSFNLGPFNHELLNPGLFNHEFLNHGVEKFVVEKSRVLRSVVEKSGVEMSFNPYRPVHNCWPKTSWAVNQDNH